MHKTPIRIALLVCALAALAFAQTEIGGASLNGAVTDPTGAAVPNAKVVITDPQTGYTRTTTSTEAGLYSFVRVPVGTYNLDVAVPGFRPYQTTGIRLTVGAVASIDVALQVGNAQETVSVSAEAPIVETTRSSAATTVNDKAVADLPINGRNFVDFTTLTPGVVRDPTRGGDLSFAGQRGPSNTLLVDGADSNNVFFGQATGRTGFRPYAFSQDAVQEFQVNNGGYNAEIGRAGGGAINVITKSGTNDFHGSAFEFYRDKGLNANSFTNNARGLPKQAYHFNQFGGSLGGRIVKDKLFFFANYDGQRNTQTQVIVPNIPVPASLLPVLGGYLTPYLVGLNNDVALGKVDWNATEKDRFSVRYNMSRYTGTNFESNGITSAQEHTGDNKVNTHNVSSSYTRVMGSTTVLDTRFNWVADDEPGFANATGPETVITNGVTFGKNNFSPRYTNTRTYQPIATLSTQKGRHSLKYGFDFVFDRVANYFPGLFAGQYIFPSYTAFSNKTPSSFSQAFSGTSTDAPISHPDVNEYAFFVQDSYRVTPKLTLNYGLRYDYFGYNQPATLNQNAALLALGLKTNQIATDKNNWGPRFGFAYNAFNSDKLVIRGGYGIYYARTPGLLLSTAILQNAIDIVNYTIAPTNAAFPTYPNILSAPPGPGAPANIYVVDPNFKTQRTQQYNLQVETALSRDLSLTVGYLGVNGTHLTRSRDINLFPSVPVTGTLAGAPVTYYRHLGGRPNTAFNRITVFESGANSIYNGGFVQLTKRFSHNLQFLTSYTWSKVIDSAPDATAVVPNNSGDDAKIAQDTLLPNLDRGPGNADIPHRFVFSGIWDLNYYNGTSSFGRALLRGWELSTIAQIQSGRRFSATVTGDPNGDGNLNNDRAPGYGRNTIIGPNLMTWDLRLTRDIAMTERVRLRLIAEGFNLTNRANFNGLQTNLYTFSNGVFTRTTNFLVPQSMYDPGVGSRAFQLAGKITF